MYSSSKIKVQCQCKCEEGDIPELKILCGNQTKINEEIIQNRHSLERAWSFHLVGVCRPLHFSNAKTPFTSKLNQTVGETRNWLKSSVLWSRSKYIFYITTNVKNMHLHISNGGSSEELVIVAYI